MGVRRSSGHDLIALLGRRSLATVCLRQRFFAHVRKDIPAGTDINRSCSDGFVYTSPVASFKPNAWGLYDMLGDVWQWTADCLHKNYLGAPRDGRAWIAPGCTSYVYRGGSWYDGPWLLRSAQRHAGSATEAYNGVGFRLAATLPSP